MGNIEEAFENTTKLLFGKALGPLTDYETWLKKRIPAGKICKSVTSEKQIYLPDYSIFKGIPVDAVADQKALSELSRKSMEIKDDENLETLQRKLRSITPCIVEFEEGENREVRDSTIYFDVHTAYKVIDCIRSKYIACSFWSDTCENVFGSIKSTGCSFAINCTKSRSVTRAFEVDSCRNCSDIMFCHNCDSVRDSLFCFNTKNKRYAICNVEIGKETYLDVRARLVGYILEELERKHTLDIDIYDLGRKSRV